MYLLDSNILIHATYAIRPELDELINSKAAHLSAISIVELLGYPELTKPHEELIEQWLSDARVLEVDETVLRRAAALRRAKRMKIGDAIIAATTLIYSLDLVTENVRDFKHIVGLNIINPFST